MICNAQAGWCGNVLAGAAYTPKQCQRCWLMTHVPAVRAAWGVPGPAVPPPPARKAGMVPLAVLPPCRHEGEVVERCTSCGDREGRHLRECLHPDNPTETCTRDHPAAAVWNCASCPQHTGWTPPPARESLLPPLAVRDIGPAGLVRTKDRGAFNGGLFRYRGRLLLAYRSGWSGSVCHVAELADDFSVVRSVWLDLRHAEAKAGAEDPRLFEHGGKLHVAFAGVWRRNGRVTTSQLYARLGDDYGVERVFAPKYAARADMEKNWGFFSHGGVLYAVYSVKPHVVLRIDGDRATKAHEEPYPWGWSGGFLRGGASPVLVGDEYLSITHGRLNHDGTSTYSVGAYTFKAEPPFQPVAAVEHPIHWADSASARADRSNLAVVFPQGAILEGGRLHVGMGRNDTRVQVATWDAAELTNLLTPAPAPPPDWFTLREGTSDRWVYDEVVGRNDYGLVGPHLAGRAVLDVGAHVGCFALAAHTRGAAVVHCYEADPENAAVLRENAGHMPGVEVLPVPVRGACGEQLGLKPLYDEWNKGGREVVPGEGLAPAVGIGEAVRRCAAADPGGRVAVLKLDCERSEWSIFAGLAADPAAAAVIDRIVGEWHPPGEMREVRAALEPLGFVVVGRPERDGRGVFTATRSYSLTEK